MTPSLKRFCNRMAKLLDVVTNTTDSHEAEFVVMNLTNNENRGGISFNFRPKQCLNLNDKHESRNSELS